MVEKLLNTLTRKTTTKAYVTNSQAIKKAVDASMKDQRELVKRAQKMTQAQQTSR